MEEACQLEYDLIEKYQTRDSNYGYNCTDGGIYHAKTEEEKEKISKSNKKFYESH